MPDVFGQETPAEALAKVRLASRDSRAAFSKTAAGQSAGGQAGTSLGAIFGGTISKGLQTHKDRQTEAKRLMTEQGLTQDQAKAQAKKNVSFGFSSVRKAETMQKIMTSAQEVMAKIAPIVGPLRTQAVGKLMVAESLRKVGKKTEAAVMSQEAAVLLMTDDARLVEKRKLKAVADLAEKNVGLAGTTGFRQNQLQRELLLGQLALPDKTDEEKERLSVQIGDLDSKILKDKTIVGRSQFDVGNDPVAMRKLFEAFTTDIVLLEGLSLAKLAMNDINAYEASFLGQAEARFRGFLEHKFAIEPSESSKDFMDRVIKSQGIPTLVAAKIRHSLTGAQMSEFEIKFLEPFLPAPNDSKQTVLAKIAAVEAYTQQTAEMRRNLIMSKTLGQFLKGHKTAFNENRKAANRPKTADDGFKSQLQKAQETSALVQQLIIDAEAREAGQQ